METGGMYDEPRFDYLFIGTGNSALTAAALLAHAGKRVLMLEAHDIPGGYAQSFAWGDYFFCGQVHYIWGCGPGGKIYEFLKKIGLEKEITFELYDPEGYDRIGMPDGELVRIPYGWDALVESVERDYPGNRAGMEKFVSIMKRLRAELRNLPDRKAHWWEYIAKSWQFRTLIRYHRATLQDVFDICTLSREAQAILSGDTGDFMLPPEKLSILAFVGLFAGYGGGAYYPTKHYKYYIDRLAQFIEEHRGSRILYKSEVVAMDTEGDRVTAVRTKDGRIFTAKTVICNMDPQKASTLIGRDKFPKDYLSKFSYGYSGSSVMIYLGLKDIDLGKFGLGKFNIWHLGDWDMNRTWQQQAAGDFSNPFVFISMPTLHTKEGGTAPHGRQIVEIGTYAEFGEFEKLKKEDPEVYEKRKNEIAEKLLDIVEARYIPNLRQHIEVKVIGTPTSNASWVWAPQGNSYGQPMTPHEIASHRLKQETPFKNFYWCNATAGYASMWGTAGNGMNLYMNLTGDHFFDPHAVPTDEQFAIQARRDFTTRQDASQ